MIPNRQTREKQRQEFLKTQAQKTKATAQDISQQEPDHTSDNKEPQSVNRLTWDQSNLKQYLKGFIFPPFLRSHQSDNEVMNFIFTSLSFFIYSTIKRPRPNYTWLEFPVPDQLIDKIGSKIICIDASAKGKIEIFKQY